MKKNIEFEIDEKEIDRKINSGKITPIHVSSFSTFSEIVKYQLCSEIIRFKKQNNLKQIEIAVLIDINKSEVSKLFSYNLKEFSQERLLGFIEVLISQNAEIEIDQVWDKIKLLSKKLEKKLKPRKGPNLLRI